MWGCDQHKEGGRGRKEEGSKGDRDGQGVVWAVISIREGGGSKGGDKQQCGAGLRHCLWALGGHLWQWVLICGWWVVVCGHWVLVCGGGCLFVGGGWSFVGSGYLFMAVGAY